MATFAKEGQDGQVAVRIEAARTALDLSFLDAEFSDGARLRVIDAGTQTSIFAVAVAAAVEPVRAGRYPDQESWAHMLGLL